MGIWDDVKKGKIPVTEGLVFEEEDEAEFATAFEVKIADNQFPLGTITFDLETWSASEIWTAQDPDFIRLTGYAIGENPVDTDEETTFLEFLFDSTDGWVIGHNIMNFDLIALAKFRGYNILQLAKADRCIDTKLLAFLADPPLSRTKEGEIEKIYSLENQGTKYLGEGKMVDVLTGKSVLKELAKEFGGYDKIPKDNERYIAYLKRDVEATRGLAKVLPMSDYTRREHKIAAVAATISLNGFRVDIPLLEQRIEEGEQKRHRILTMLMEYGLPGPETTKAPQMTKVGKAAIDLAFSERGVTLPRTASGQPALGKEILLGVIEDIGSRDQEVTDLAEAVLGLNGIRTIYGNIHDNLVGDRVHPDITLRQSSGRWSITNPGITVLGKRDGKVKERQVFIADEGCVLISVDLAQVDARAVAGLSQDTEYLKLFEPGRDLHSEMAVRLFGTTDARERAKAAAHGINYGMRPNKLSLTTGMTLPEAEEVVYNFESSFPRLAEWQYKVREVGQVSGVLYNGFGRLMKIEPERAFTQAPALMGQSTARDILMEGILRLWDMGGERVIHMIRAVIHDELVMSVPLSEVEEIERLVEEALSFPWCPVGGTYPVQIMAGLNQRGSNWAGCYGY